MRERNVNAWRLLVAALFVSCLTATSVRADDREMALALVNQAIKAHGGMEALERAQVAVRSGSGVIYGPAKNEPFTDEMTWQLPERLRLQLDVGKETVRTRIILVVTPERGWQSTGGAVEEVGKDRLHELQEEAYVLWLMTLTPLVKVNDFTLTPAGETKVDSRPALGIKASHKGHGDVKLYFDKESNLLVKMERRGLEAGIPADKEYFYMDHKDFDGVKLPTALLEFINGKRFTELKRLSYRFPRNLDDSIFTRP